MLLVARASGDKGDGRLQLWKEAEARTRGWQFIAGIAPLAWSGALAHSSLYELKEMPLTRPGGFWEVSLAAQAG